MNEEIKQILDAVNALSKRIDSIEERIESGGAHGKKTVWELTRIMEAKEKEAQEVKNKFSSEVAMGTQWLDESSRQEYVKLRRSIKELNSQIASLS